MNIAPMRGNVQRCGITYEYDMIALLDMEITVLDEETRYWDLVRKTG